MNFWPFKKKEQKPDLAEIALNEIRSFRKIGETFIYCGRTCVVTGHTEYWPYVGVVATLRCDYADDYGVIHSISFKPSEIAALRRQQEK